MKFLQISNKALVENTDASLETPNTNAPSETSSTNAPSETSEEKKKNSVVSGSKELSSNFSDPSTNKNLAFITRLDNGSFQCNPYGKLYKQKGSLVKHLGKNHSIILSEFICETCEKVFEDQRKLS